MWRVRSMLFNSFSFAVFFPVVTIPYFALPQRWKNPFLLVASCVFYCAAMPAFLLILWFTIIVDYFDGLPIEWATGRRRKPIGRIPRRREPVFGEFVARPFSSFQL